MKKIFLLLCFLALCMTLYSLSSAYAMVITLQAMPNNTKQSAGMACGYGNPSTALNLRPCGDPIIDPRPK